MKVVYSGLESSGKSLRLAMEIAEIVNRNAKWFLKQQQYLEKHGQREFEIRYGRAAPVARPLVSNLKLSDEFVRYMVNDCKLPPPVYWENIDELVLWHDADIIIDELGNYFDSRMWAELSLDTRRWLSQGAKAGIEIYGSAQDFAQVDKAFRRLVNHLYFIRKLIGSSRPSATRPPVKRIWGYCMLTELDPQGYNEDKKKFKSTGLQIPELFWIGKQYCEMFDTTQVIHRSKLPALKHIEHTCERPDCEFNHSKYRIKHA